jgi:competence CoiA-like predicted nuclease
MASKLENSFGKENSEIVIKQDGIKHIADILTSNKVVIELQNSPIRKPDIRKRELFYGEICCGY